MKFHDLSKRLTYACIAIALLVLILIFAYNPIIKWCISLLASGLASIGMWEFAKMTKIGEDKNRLSLLVILAAIVTFSFFLSTLSSALIYLPWAILFIAAVILFVYHFNKIEGAARSIGLGFFGIVYVAMPLGLLLSIFYSSTEADSRLWILYILAVTKLTDAGAYFAGRLFGKEKLAPHLSPGKTRIGAVSGFITAIVISLIFYFIGLGFENFSLTLIQSLILGALVGCLGQLGDLAESLLKREADLKDSNRLPGLGGVLDTLDSLLFTIPLVYFFTRMA